MVRNFSELIECAGSLKQHLSEQIGNAGMDDPNSPFIGLDKALKDDKRIRYHEDYLSNLSAAIRYMTG